MNNIERAQFIEQIQQQLINTGDFLAITRKHECSLPAFSFELSSQISHQSIKVSVVDTGIIMFEPIINKSNKDIVLSCAVHGNETAPIEICANLIQQLLLGKLTLAERVLFLFGNPPAINIGKRFVEENLNRLFSGAHGLNQTESESSVANIAINKEQQRALLLESSVRDFFLSGETMGSDRQRYHYDLHTAIRGSKNDKFAVYPFRHGKPWQKNQLQFMLACDISTILLSHSPTTTFSYFSSNEFGAHAFTVELGKVKPFGENDMANFQGVCDTLERFISGEDLQLKGFQADDFAIFEIYKTVNRNHENFQLNFSDDVENFTDFPLGTVIATDGEQAICTDKIGEAVIFPNADVAIGQRALLTVVPTSIT